MPFLIIYTVGNFGFCSVGFCGLWSPSVDQGQQQAHAYHESQYLDIKVI
jgi:hypothetical protein